MAITINPSFDPATGIITLQGHWSASRFKKLIRELGLKNIKQVVVTNTCTLHLENMQFDNITVERFGYVSISHCVLGHVVNNGVIRMNCTTMTDVNNDGQIYANALSRLKTVDNHRLINISRSFLQDATFHEKSVLKATSSWISFCYTMTGTSLHFGSSMAVHCTGTMSGWSKPAFDDADASLFIDDFVLMFAVIDLLSRVDYVDSKTVIKEQRVSDLITVIDDLIVNKEAKLPCDLAKELASRISVLSTAARDILAYTVGEHLVPYKTSGIGPKPNAGEKPEEEKKSTPKTAKTKKKPTPRKAKTTKRKSHSSTVKGT